MKELIMLLLVIFTISVVGQLINSKIAGLFKGRTVNNNSYTIKPLMTKYEKYFYDILVELENELDIKIHPQVNLATIIHKETNNHYINELFKNIDFAIFNKDYSKLILLIEINDKTHNAASRRTRDKKVAEILKNANVKLIKFYSNYPNKKDYIKQRIMEEIKILKTEEDDNT